jgi:ABC-type lipoprotein export system ATPase subunit
MEYPRGSEWRKWDLQVQTRFDQNYTPVGASHGLSHDDFFNLQKFSGLTADEITIQETQISLDKYAKLLLAYTQLFTDIRILGITDHNTGDMLDDLIRESKNFEVSIIPGVEVSSVQGIHMLCLFDPEIPWKKTWAGAIESLMTELDCKEPFSDTKQPKNCKKPCEAIMEIVANHGGLVIYPHIVTDNGLFKKSAIAASGNVHADIYKHRECRAVQIPTSGVIGEGIKNIIEGKDPNYGSKKVAQIRCSDSRSLKDVGSGYVWIKANPDFHGLVQALHEPEERVTLAAKPDVLKRLELNSTKIIDKVKVRKKPTSDLKEDWFSNIDLPLNPGLSAVIGNKGSGKSAIADIIGLLGNSKQYKYFSFLNENKFLKGKNPKASHFDADILWQSKEVIQVTLTDRPNETATEKVKYIPQHYLEKICEITDVTDNASFEDEIQGVIFSHVEYSERLGQSTLQDLIKIKTKQIEDNCDLLREQLHSLNEGIVDLETKLSKKSRAALDNKISEKEEQLKAILAKKPEGVPEPDPTQVPKEQSEKLETLRAAVTKLEEEKKTALETIMQFNSKLIRLRNLKAEVENFQGRANELKKRLDEELAEFGLSSGNLLKITTNFSEVDVSLSDLQTALDKERKKAFDDQGDNLIQKLIDAKIEGMRILEQELDAPSRKHQAYLKELDNWNKAKAEIEGDEKKLGSLAQLKTEKKALDTIKGTLDQRIEQRYAISTLIFSEINKLKAEYQTLYTPIQKIMEKTEKDAEVELSFSASIAPSDFSNTFLGYINKSRAGTFKGSEDGARRLRDLMISADFQVANSVREFLSTLAKALLDGSTDTMAARVQEQINSPQKILEFYDYIFSLRYLIPKYDLLWSGKKPDELSPGERGCMLLVFYLILDKRDHPLIIDQPEENLDNQTIYKILVPCVRKAKNRRQIIVVTHNPNIAVNCDADQIICASINKKNKNRVSYKSGGIEDPDIRAKIIDILEGTEPAFVKRSSTYRIK